MELRGRKDKRTDVSSREHSARIQHRQVSQDETVVVVEVEKVVVVVVVVVVGVCFRSWGDVREEDWEGREVGCCRCLLLLLPAASAASAACCWAAVKRVNRLCLLLNRERLCASLMRTVGTACFPPRD